MNQGTRKIKGTPPALIRRIYPFGPVAVRTRVGLFGSVRVRARARASVRVRGRCASVHVRARLGSIVII